MGVKGNIWRSGWQRKISPKSEFTQNWFKNVTLLYLFIYFIPDVFSSRIA